MKLWQWLVRKRLHDHTDELPVTNPAEAAEAVKQRQVEREEVEQSWTRVNIVTRGLAEQKQANHFGNLVNEAMRRKPST